MSADKKDNPGVVGHPPLILLGFLLGAFLIDYYLPLPVLPAEVQYSLGGVLIAGGVAVFVLAVRPMRRAGTNIPTNKATTAIVSGGPYRYSRNPIYLSATIASVGIAVMADSVWVLASLIPFLIIINRGVIDREEKYLENKFGKDYLDYKASVRRWL